MRDKECEIKKIQELQFIVKNFYYLINITKILNENILHLRTPNQIYWEAVRPPPLDILAISSLNFAIVSLASVNFSLRSTTSLRVLFLASVMAFSVPSFLASTASKMMFIRRL